MSVVPAEDLLRAVAGAVKLKRLCLEVPQLLNPARPVARIPRAAGATRYPCDGASNKSGKKLSPYAIAQKASKLQARIKDAAFRHRDFAQELPRFISEVRRMFTPEEIVAQLTRIERKRNQKDEDVVDKDDPLGEIRPVSQSELGSS
jgi:hypothetical protein